MDSDSCSVRVVARFRPINERERKEGEREQFVLDIVEDTRIVIKSKSSGQHNFNFDRTFGCDSHQDEVYEYTAKQTIQDVLDGYNGTIFAYGQTGSGKTFTMFGPDEITDESLQGIVPRAAAHIFETIRSDTREIQYSIKASFLEIYKERIRDLLNPSKDNLPVRESTTKGIYVEGLTEEYVGCEEDIAEIIAQGEKSRSVASTNMNQRSSRSHSLMIITIEQKNLEDDSTRVGRLNLIDLAGSEKVGKTGASGNTLEEAKKINQSLSALGNCIHALTEAKRGHVPYRDSKLTRVLQESLGGNTKTTLVVTASPHVFNLEETVSSLRFGARAKTIQNKVSQNVQRSAEELMIIVQTLKSELLKMRRYSSQLEKQIAYMKSPEYDPSKPMPKELLASAPVRTPSKKGSKGTPTSKGTPSAKNTPKSSGVKSAVRGSGTPMSASKSSASKAASASASTPTLAAPTGHSRSPSSGGDYDPFALAEAKMNLDKLKLRHANQVDELNDKINEANLALEEQKSALEAAEESAKELQLQILATKQAADEAQEELESRLQDAKDNFERERHKVENLKLSLEERESACQSLEEKLEEKEAQLRQLCRERDELQEDMDALKSSSEQEGAASRRLEESIALVRTQLAAAEQRAEASQADAERAKEQRQQSATAREESEAAREALQLELVEAHGAVEVAAQQRTQLEQRLAQVQKELERAEDSYRQLKSSISSSEARQRSASVKKSSLGEGSDPAVKKEDEPTEETAPEDRPATEEEEERDILVETLKSEAERQEEKLDEAQQQLQALSASAAAAEAAAHAAKTEATKQSIELSSLRSRLEEEERSAAERERWLQEAQEHLAAAKAQAAEAAVRQQGLERNLEHQTQQAEAAKEELQESTHKLHAKEQECRKLSDLLEKEQRKLDSEATSAKAHARDLANVQQLAEELKASLAVEKKSSTSAKHEAACLALENQRLTEELAEKVAAAKSHAEELEALQTKLTEVESRRSRLFKPIRVGPAFSSKAKPMHVKINYNEARSQLRRVARDLTK